VHAQKYAPSGPVGTCGCPSAPRLTGAIVSVAQQSRTPHDPFLHVAGAALVIALLADKWTIPLIHALARGTKRTSELKRALGVSQKMLTQTLRTLEDHGLVARQVHAEVPPRVEYSLTPLGRSLNEPLTVICEWTEAHGAELERARSNRRRPRGITAG
jgi:DNA-binding HxlR family transcriptional regulator